ncbi:PHP domain-containing protein [Spirochaetia bacterium 38H-sp]|uniref:PHP domain-containing protein n=1 Tax=Rarispira pelagica TaxID=3141764 RepID=A0ABU9UCY8_9SPIR
MKERFFDFHAHSTVSDGELSPEELVAYAAKRKLDLLAVTDHDSYEGIEPAMCAASELGITLIPGIELEVEYDGGEFHLLGLGIDEDCPELLGLIERMREERVRRNNRILDKLDSAGIPISIEEIAARGVITRPHIANVLVERGLAASVSEAMQEYLIYGKPFYEPKVAASFEEAVSAVHAADGVAVMAHPVTLRLSPEDFINRLRFYKEAGLDGIEAYHTSHRESEAEFFCSVAQSLRLMVSAGSDFHGKGRRNAELGNTCCNMRIKDSMAMELVERLVGISV